MTTAAAKDPLLDNLIWSDIEYQLHKFVERFEMPQIVKVQEGYYGPTEDSCIGAEQILTLHCVKSTEKILARDRRKKELNIPLNCSQKVELRHADFRGVYDTVEQISKIPTKFVRITQGYYGLEDGSISLNPGDKLELIRVEHGGGGKEGSVLFHNEERTPISLPFSVSAGFQSLLDGREYYLKQLVDSSLQLPVYFQFIDPPSLTRRSAESVFNSSLGVLELVKVYKDETIICTTKEGNTRSVVSCPMRLPVTVNVARGALSEEKDYVRICRSFHDGVCLAKIDSMETQNIYASRDTIREYEYIEVHPAPPVPRRLARGFSGDSPNPSPPVTKKNTSKVQSSTVNSDDCHAYEKIEDHPRPQKTPKDYQCPRGANKSHSMALTPALPKGSDASPGDDHDECESTEPPPECMVEQIERPTPPATKVNVEQSNRKSSPPPLKPKPKIKPQGIEHPSKKDNFVVPDDLSQMTVDEVSKFLIHFNLKEFVEVCAADQVDGSLFVSLDEKELKSIGMSAFQCKKVLKLIGGWRPKQ